MCIPRKEWYLRHSSRRKVEFNQGLLGCTSRLAHSLQLSLAPDTLQHKLPDLSGVCRFRNLHNEQPPTWGIFQLTYRHPAMRLIGPSLHQFIICIPIYHKPLHSRRAISPRPK